jgi:polysaccharide biosynthesis transport protein
LVINQTQSDKSKIPEYTDMLQTITTQPVKDTEILKVKVRAKSAEEAQHVANTLVNTFIERITYLARAEQSTVREFIGVRLQESKKDLERAESLLEEYKRHEKIVAPAEETRAMVDGLAAITKLQAENTVALAAAQAKLANAEQQILQEKPGFIAENPLIQQYKSKLADLEVQLVSLAENYTDKHPKVIAAKAAIEETRIKLNGEIAHVINVEAPSMNPIHQALLQGKMQAEAEIAVATVQKDASETIIKNGETDLAKLPGKEQGLARVMRDASVAQEIYTMLAKRHEEARISEVMEPTDVQVIDIAVPPQRPIKPKKLLNIVIAAFLGLFAGTAWAFFKEYMDRSIQTPEDVKHYLDLPVIGNIPDFNGEINQQPPTGWLAKIKQLIKRDTKTNTPHGF